MKPAKLTKTMCPSHKRPMKGQDRAMGKAVAGVAAMLCSVLAAGCISVNAPSEPIVIELNVNITQEVIYRLAEDVRQNIDDNPEIF